MSQSPLLENTCTLSLIYIGIASTTITAVYRKSFKITASSSELVQFVIALFFVCLGAYLGNANMFSLPICVVAVIFSVLHLKNSVEQFEANDWIKNILIFIPFCAMCYDWEWFLNWSIEIACSIAISQIFRYPGWLRVQLQNVRIVFGPMYVITLGCSMTRELYSYWSVARFILALLAAVIFRPDNTEMLQIILKNPAIKLGVGLNFSRRRYVHGILMFSSAIMTATSLNSLSIGGIVSIMAIITILYCIGSLFPQYLFRKVAPPFNILDKSVWYPKLTKCKQILWFRAT